MTLVTVPQSNPNDEITALAINQGPNAIATVVNGQLDDTNISSLSGSKIAAGTIPAASFDANSNPETRLSEALGNFVASGLVWSISSGLVGAMTTGVVYIGGKRILPIAIASKTFTASQDTYVSVSNTGTVAYSPVANNAASPTLPANSVWLAIVVSGASAITSINTGKTSAIAPVFTQAVVAVCDTNGQLIYPTANQRLIGYRVSTTNMSSMVNTLTLIPGCLLTVNIPTNRAVRVSLEAPLVSCSVAASANGAIYNSATVTGTALASSQNFLSTSGVNGKVQVSLPVSLSGSQTFCGAAAASTTGSGTMTNNLAGYVTYIAVELD